MRLSESFHSFGMTGKRKRSSRRRERLLMMTYSGAALRLAMIGKRLR